MPSTMPRACPVMLARELIWGFATSPNVQTRMDLWQGICLPPVKCVHWQGWGSTERSEQHPSGCMQSEAFAARAPGRAQLRCR